MPKTLDEYCSPALAPDILTSRNEDQVLWRYEKRKNTVFTECGDDQQEAQAFLSGIWTLVVLYMRKLRHPRPKRQQSGEIRKPANAVFVSQACIWQIGKQVFAPPPQSTYPDLPNTAWDRLRCSDPSVFITLFLGELVDRFNTPRPGGETLLKAYENALVFISQDVNEYTKSLLIEDIDLEQEKALFHQISDLREELSMIKYVLSQQETVWNEYTSHMWPTQVPGQQSSRDSSTRSARDKEMEESVIPRQLLRTKAKFSQYNRRITKLEEDAERVERNISTKLDLRQKHAIMREAHSAAMLSATVFGFTIITVIFAPLSFVVALFALPIDKFNEGKEGKDKDGVYSSNYIGKWSVATELASIAITLVAMWAALRFVGIHAWGKKGIRDYVSQKVQEIRTAESNYDNNPNNV
ncbi:hypothetical protein F4860DRAFT_506316 [Xylaria cubensis]|nr:hypothetical protein F4860DRAFT_506316 [Xylaria cubensis]